MRAAETIIRRALCAFHYVVDGIEMLPARAHLDCLAMVGGRPRSSTVTLAASDVTLPCSFQTCECTSHTRSEQAPNPSKIDEWICNTMPIGQQWLARH